MNIGDTVQVINVPDFNPTERKLLEGRIGTITRKTYSFYEVYFEKDSTWDNSVRNRVLFRPSEIVPLSRFNFYYLANGEGKSVDNCTLSDILSLTKKILSDGHEITGIVNSEID